jgi:hypothetical protein
MANFNAGLFLNLMGNDCCNFLTNFKLFCLLVILKSNAATKALMRKTALKKNYQIVIFLAIV